MILTIALLAAAAGVAFTCKLCQPGELLDFWPVLANKITCNEKLLKVLYACESCIAGQLAFWAGGAYLITTHQYNPWVHLCAVPLAILFAHITAILTKILETHAEN